MLENDFRPMNLLNGQSESPTKELTYSFSGIVEEVRC
jgi:hypothetical protein